MTISFDSLVMPPIKQKNRINVIKRYPTPHRYIPLGGIKALQKMIAHPHKQTLHQRLMECQRRLRQKEVAVTTTKHISPRSKRRRSRRRSPHRSRRRSPRRSRRRSPRRSRRRSPRRSPHRSRRRSKRPREELVIEYI